jgi:hypothetical protein
MYCGFFNPCWYLPTFLIFYLATSDKVYQLVAHCQWFSLDTPASSITKTGCHDIAEILLKVELNTKNHKTKVKSLIRAPNFCFKCIMRRRLLYQKRKFIP